jgi:GNAT superfamily N-acetyltransferase
MTLRLATVQDYGDIIRMAKSFHEKSPYSQMEFSEDRCEELFRAYLEGDKRSLIIILAVDKRPFGMIIGHCAELPFSDDRVSSEVAWWVDEDKRGHKDSVLLMKAYQDWALRVGARMTQMAMLDDVTDLDKFYRRQGFVPAERSYVKVT